MAWRHRSAATNISEEVPAITTKSRADMTNLVVGPVVGCDAEQPHPINKPPTTSPRLGCGRRPPRRCSGPWSLRTRYVLCLLLRSLTGLSAAAAAHVCAGSAVQEEEAHQDGLDQSRRHRCGRDGHHRGLFLPVMFHASLTVLFPSPCSSSSFFPPHRPTTCARRQRAFSPC